MRRLLIAVPLCAVAACQDATRPVEPEVAPASEMSFSKQGQSGLTTVPHFYFLPPLGTQPKKTGQFDAAWAPVVEVCRLSSSGTCVQVVAWFTMDGSSQGSPIDVNPNAGHYKVNWNSGASSIPNGKYRLSVLTARSDQAHQVFGTADLWLESNMSKAKSAAKAGEYPMVNGSTLPLKFRIDVGALCPTATCTHGTFDGDGGIVTNLQETTGVFVPPGAVTGTYNLFIEEYTGPNACLPTHQPQFRGCYTYRTEPAIAEFQEEVVVGVCLDPAALPFVDEMRLWKVATEDADGPVNPPSLVELPRRIVDFLECENYMVAAQENPLLRGLSWAGRVMQPLASLLGPAPVQAKVPVPFGGGLADFSRVGWVRWLNITKVSGDNQSATKGTAVSLDPKVRVTSRVTGNPVSGVAIDFEPSVGGAAAPLSAVTDANGLASTHWTLAATLGVQTLVANGRNLSNSFPNRAGVWNTTTFSATAVVPKPPPPAPVYKVAFLEPVGTASSSKSNVSTLQPVVEVCRQVGSKCNVVASLGVVPLAHNKQYYAINWYAPKTLVKGDYYRIRVLLDGVEVGKTTMRAVDGSKHYSKDDDTFRIGSTLAIKFVMSVKKP